MIPGNTRGERGSKTGKGKQAIKGALSGQRPLWVTETQSHRENSGSQEKTRQRVIPSAVQGAGSMYTPPSVSHWLRSAAGGFGGMTLQSFWPAECCRQSRLWPSGSL